MAAAASTAKQQTEDEDVYEYKTVWRYLLQYGWKYRKSRNPLSLKGEYYCGNFVLSGEDELVNWAKVNSIWSNQALVDEIQQEGQIFDALPNDVKKKMHHDAQKARNIAQISSTPTKRSRHPHAVGTQPDHDDIQVFPSPAPAPTTETPAPTTATPAPTTATPATPTGTQHPPFAQLTSVRLCLNSE